MKASFILFMLALSPSLLAEEYKGFIRKVHHQYYLVDSNIYKENLSGKILLKFNQNLKKFSNVYVSVDGDIKKCDKTLCLQIKKISPEIFNPLFKRKFPKQKQVLGKSQEGKNDG